MFEQDRHIVLGVSMMGVRGQVQREDDIIHIIARRLDDLSSILASAGARQVSPMSTGSAAPMW